jgi:GTPase SAR1 family protein
MSAQYYRNVQLAILVYDVTKFVFTFSLTLCSAATLEAVEKYVQELRTHVPKDETVVMLIGNKIDLNRQRQVSTNQGLEFTIRLKIPLFFEICAIKEYSVVERVVNIGARATYDVRKYKYSMQQINQIYNNGSWNKIDSLFEQRMLERIKDGVLSDVIVNCT